MRERPNDIVPIAKRLIERHAPADQPVPVLTAEAEEKLRSASWQGNIRELENVVQRALILKRGGEILPDDLLMEMGGGAVVAAPEEIDVAEPTLQPVTESPTESVVQSAPAAGGSLKEYETQMILDALANSMTRQEVAEKLGISPRTLRYKIAKLKDAGYEIPS